MGKRATGIRVTRAPFPGKVGSHKKRGGKKLMDLHCSLCYASKDSFKAQRCVNVFCPVRTEEPEYVMDDIKSARPLEKK